MKNWRPISLLNVDYKICSKAISLRLAKVLGSIVDADQTCSVSGRSMFSNLVLLRETLAFIERTNETGILVSLDQEKASNPVDRCILLNILELFGFGLWFRTRIATVYKAISEIEGFLLPGSGGLQFKVCQYSHDTRAFVKNERSLIAVLETISQFECGSGAKLN